MQQVQPRPVFGGKVPRKSVNIKQPAPVPRKNVVSPFVKNRPDRATRIARAQIEGELSVPKRSFQRLVRSFTEDIAEYLFNDSGIRFQKAALELLHEAYEHFIVTYLRDANEVAIHCGKVTVKAQDLQLVRKIKNFITAPPTRFNSLPDTHPLNDNNVLETQLYYSRDEIHDDEEEDEEDTMTGNLNYESVM